MRHFTCVQDLGDLKQALNEAFEIKKDRFQFTELGKNKTLLMIFFNSSLRTRLSTQKAAMNLDSRNWFDPAAFYVCLIATDKHHC